MAERTDRLTRADISAVRRELAKLVEALPQTGPIAITRYGKTVALLIEPSADIPIPLETHGVNDVPGPSTDKPPSWKQRQSRQAAIDELLGKTKK